MLHTGALEVAIERLRDADDLLEALLRELPQPVTREGLEDAIAEACVDGRFLAAFLLDSAQRVLQGQEE